MITLVRRAGELAIVGMICVLSSVTSGARSLKEERFLELVDRAQKVAVGVVVSGEYLDPGCGSHYELRVHEMYRGESATGDVMSFRSRSSLPIGEKLLVVFNTDDGVREPMVGARAEEAPQPCRVTKDRLYAARLDGTVLEFDGAANGATGDEWVRLWDSRVLVPASVREYRAETTVDAPYADQYRQPYRLLKWDTLHSELRRGN